MMPFGLKIAIINRAFRKKLDEKAAAMGLTAVQLRVLGSVSRLEATTEDEIHQNDLERLEHVSHPAMTKGFIRCVPSARDRRYKVITCTERSAGIHNMILAQDEEVFAELCGTLSAQERASLQHLADAIVQNIDQETLSEPEN